MTTNPRNHIALTGASGFLGTEIIRQAQAFGHRLRGVSRRPPSDPSLDHISADIADINALTAAFKGCATVIHAAGLAHVHHANEASDNLFHQVNVIGSQNVAKAAIAAGVAHLVHISSVSVYGSHTPTMYDETSPTAPEGAYALSKLESEHVVQEIATEHYLPVTILRLGTLYGPNDPGNIARLIRIVHKGRFIWIGPGDNKKSLIHVGEVARAVLKVIGCEAAYNETFIVCDPQPYEMRQIVATIAHALGKQPPRLHIPFAVAQSLAGVNDWLNRQFGFKLPLSGRLIQRWRDDNIYSPAKIEQRVGFKSQLPLSQGIQSEVAWLLQHPK